MRKKINILLCAAMVVVCVGLSSSAFAANVFFNVANGDWNVPGNWNTGYLPGSTAQDSALIDARICNVTTNVAITNTTRVYVRYAGAQLNIAANLSNTGSWGIESNAATLPAPTVNQTAGTVTAVWDGYIGKTNNFPAVFNLSGGTFNLGSGHPSYLLQVVGNGGRFNISGTGRAELNSSLKVAAGAQVNMTGGFLDTDYNGGGGTSNMLTIDLGGTVTISGGTANLKSRSLVNGTLAVVGSAATITMGTATAADGCVTNASTGTFKFVLGAAGVSPITSVGNSTDFQNAKLMIDGSAYAGATPATITLFDTAAFAAGGTFKAANVTVSYLGVEGTGWSLTQTAGDVKLTILQPAKPNCATLPIPRNGGIAASAMPVSWTAGAGARAHDVFVSNGVNPPAYRGRVTTTTYNDPNFTAAGTYYWKVNEVTDPNFAWNSGDPSIYVGDVWSYTYDPGLASNPSPADGASNIALTQQKLSWTKGAGALTHDVYFGTDAGSLALVSDNQTDPNYAIASRLYKGQTFFWRIVEWDGTYEHVYPNAWSFTMAAAPANTNWSGATSRAWNTETNWSSGVPGVLSNLNLQANKSGGVVRVPLIDASTTVVATGTWRGGAAYSATYDPNYPVLEMTGGSLTAGGGVILANYGKATFNMSGGTATIAEYWAYCDNKPAQTLTTNVSGGTLNITWYRNLSDTGGTRTLNLSGGIVNITTLTVGTNNLWDFKGGTMVLAGDQTGAINAGVTAGWIKAYGGLGKVVADYNVRNAGKTTVTACPDASLHDLDGDCNIDIAELQILVQNWLFQTPDQVIWSKDMATDPVGTGIYDLKVRVVGGVPANGYTMTTDGGGESVLNVTGTTDLLLDQQYPVSDGRFDAAIHYVVKSTSADPVHLWYTQGMSYTGPTDPNMGKQAYVGISTDAAGGVQTVKLWIGNPPHVAPFNPVVLTGFSASAYLTIDVTYDYSANTFDYTVTDGATTQSATGVAYTYLNAGNGGSFTLQSQVFAGYLNRGTALVDQLDVSINGSTWYSVADFQPDGSVDLVDFAVIATEWLKP